MDSTRNTTSGSDYYPEYGVAEQQDHLPKFNGELDNLRPKLFFPLDADSMIDNLNHTGNISYNIPVPSQPGFYMDPSLYHELDKHNQLPHQATFDIHELRALGRENSRHGVFFGNLLLQNYSTMTNYNIDVAVKPYSTPNSQRRGLHEYGLYEYLGKLGIDVPTQLGLIVSGDKTLYTISEFAPEIITLDSLDWSKLDPSTAMGAVARGIESLVTLHSVGVFHGDPEFKNLTLQPEKTRNWIVDLELATSLRDYDHSEDPTAIIMQVIHDLAKVMKSLDDFGLTSNAQSDSEIFQMQYNLVLRPYREMIYGTLQPSCFSNLIRAQLDTVDQYFYSLLLKKKALA